MDTRRWFNRSQPQTLQIAVMLFYWNAAWSVLSGAVFSPVGLLFVAGAVGAGFGIANEKKWGYALGLFIAVLNVLLVVWLAGGLVNVFRGLIILTFIFAVALLAALLHPMSRDYQRIWFR